MNRREMYGFIARQPAACIAMTDRNGTPAILPLPGPAYRDGDVLCFIVRKSDPKIRLLENNPHASLCFQSLQRPYCCVTLDGRVRIARDADIFGKTWNSTVQSFYGGYCNDPDFSVLHFIWHSAGFRTSTSAAPIF